jgi:uncharacterized protein YbgA (DUF1722 family)
MSNVDLNYFSVIIFYCLKKRYATSREFVNTCLHILGYFVRYLEKIFQNYDGLYMEYHSLRELL